MNVQFIEQDGKRQYAVVPIEIYNDLLEKAEMQEDLAAYHKAKADADDETGIVGIVFIGLNTLIPIGIVNLFFL